MSMFKCSYGLNLFSQIVHFTLKPGIISACVCPPTLFEYDNNNDNNNHNNNCLAASREDV